MDPDEAAHAATALAGVTSGKVTIHRQDGMPRLVSMAGSTGGTRPLRVIIRGGYPDGA